MEDPSTGFGREAPIRTAFRGPHAFSGSGTRAACGVHTALRRARCNAVDESRQADRVLGRTVRPALTAREGRVRLKREEVWMRSGRERGPGGACRPASAHPGRTPAQRLRQLLSMTAMCETVSVPLAL